MLKARIVDGVKVAVTPEQVTMPTIGVVACCIVKVALLTVDGDKVSLKTAAIALLTATPMAVLSGMVDITVGGVVSGGEIARVAKPIFLSPPVDCAV